jgi:hypothetical protein
MDDTLNWLLAQLPSEEELRERIDELGKQISVLAGQQAALQGALSARELAVAARSRLETGAAPERLAAPDAATNGSRPGIGEAVRLVLQDAPDRTMSVKDLMQVLETRGWLPIAKDPRKAVGATLSRMAHRTHELEYVERATYRLRRDPAVGRRIGSQETVSNRLFIGSADGEAESEAS